jgi:DNA-dependent RNA polymerase auxiliary subunit epsilon
MIQNMAKYIDAENDYLYIKGKQEEQNIVVENLLEQTDFNIDKIANIANVSIEFVLKVKDKIRKIN